jgi:cell division protein FtsB
MGSIMKLLQDVLYRYAKIPSHFVNKYTLVGFLFVIWVGIFDTHSLWETLQLNRTINRLEKEKIELKKNIENAKSDRKDLENNQEKYAREKYYMHRENEEVFIIEREK